MHTPRHLDPKVTAIRNLDLFRLCSDRELREVARLSCEAEIPAGRVICRQGEVGRQAFVIVDGQAAVDIDGISVGVIGPGGIAGEMALLDNGPRVATVTALTPMTVLVLSPPEFTELLSVAPSAARRMLIHLGSRLRIADKAVASASV
jgi:CRP-like cAMP-binding protein